MLAEKLFNDPSAFLLKLVQAAVASHSSAIHFQARPDRLVVRFHSAELDLTQLPEVEELLRRPLEDASPAVRCFLLALHAARPGTEELAYATRSASGGRGFVLTTAGLQTMNLAGARQQVAECVLLLRRAIPESSWRGLLERRCCFCSIPVVWNGRRLNGRPFRQAAGEGAAPFWLAQRLYLRAHHPADSMVLPPLHAQPAWCYDVGSGLQDCWSRGSTLLHQWRSYASPLLGAEPLFERVATPRFHLAARRGWMTPPEWFVPASDVLLYAGSIRPGDPFRNLARRQALSVSGVSSLGYAPWSGRPSGWFRPERPMLCSQASLRLPALAEPGARSLVHTVWNGVLLEPRELPADLGGLEVTVCDARGGVDLSGLVPLRNERSARLDDWLWRECTTLRDDLGGLLVWSDKMRLPLRWLKAVRQRHRLRSS